VPFKSEPSSVPKTEKYAPRHRAPAKHKAARSASARMVRTSVVLTGVAVAVTGVSVSGGVLGSSTGSAGDLASAAVGGVTVASADSEPTSADTVQDAGGDAAGDTADDTALERRESVVPVSRSDRRGATDATKRAALSVAKGPAVTRSEDLSSSDPRDIARALLPEFGFDSSQFSCLDSLYVSESNWRIDADNPTSSAYGIPQALTQLHDLPADYMTSAESQIRWGLGYIQDTYGTPCNAWSFKTANNWY
jgi:hypothetical protein